MVHESLMDFRMERCLTVLCTSNNKQIIPQFVTENMNYRWVIVKAPKIQSMKFHFIIFVAFSNDFSMSSKQKNKAQDNEIRESHG